MSSYAEKLRDPRWQKKRLEVMQRDGFSCQYCGNKNETLNVHHRVYLGSPWSVPNEMLETLCESCHEKRSALNKLFAKLDTNSAFVLEDIIKYLQEVKTTPEWYDINVLVSSINLMRIASKGISDPLKDS